MHRYTRTVGHACQVHFQPGKFCWAGDKLIATPMETLKLKIQEYLEQDLLSYCSSLAFVAVGWSYIRLASLTVSLVFRSWSQNEHGRDGIA